MFLLPLYEQQARGRSALDAGLLLVPQGLGILISLVLIGRRANRLSPRLLVLVGLALSVVGSIPYTQVGSEPSELLLGISLVVRGAGLGAAMLPTMTTAYHGLRHDQIPRATTAVRIFQQIGGSLGVAVLAVILSHQISAHAGAAGADAAGGGAASSSGPLADAFGTAFWWSTILTVLALPFALLLPGRPATDIPGALPGTDPRPAPPSPAPPHSASRSLTA
jgi:predicted MFS family arabinose efflux permease